MLDRPRDLQVDGDPNDYVVGTISALGGGKHTVVGTLLKKPGNNSAATAAADLLRSFPTVEEVLMVGIAAGTPNPEKVDLHVRLGDIVVSDVSGILQYDLVKLSNGIVEIRSTSAPPSARLIGRLHILEADRLAGKYPWEHFIARANHLEGCGRPDAGTDRLFSCAIPPAEIAHPEDPYRTRRPGLPKVFYGRIGSANTLLRDCKLRDRLRDQYDVRAIEMEGSGVADSTWTHQQSYLVIRGISDYGDGHKNDLWHGYGAVVAAAFARALLEAVPSKATGKKRNKRTIGARSSLQGRKSTDRRALERLRHLTAIVRDDAREIPGSGPESRPIYLDESLYVPRSIEQELEHLIADAMIADPVVAVIVGEAGNGKTTLLWKLHHALTNQSRWEPWFLKASMLSMKEHEEATGRFDISDILQAINALKTKKPILFLDTVDLLLHSERERDALLELLVALRSHNCPVIATCRPQEATRLRSAGAHHLMLGPYTKTELDEAVAKHVARFYKNAVPRDRQEHLLRIQEAVALGLPIREICSIPLTLRMLFSLYAPEEVPVEIHAFRLYDEYWKSRVVQDVRAGSLPADLANNSLERSCWLASLTMLAEGTPEIDERRVERVLSEFGASPEDIWRLASRAVIRRSEAGTISFFHQTFFEHSAARAILGLMGTAGLALMRRRIKASPNDLFLSPIHEQLLLLSEFDVSLRSQGNSALAELLSIEGYPRMSGIYVYAHLSNPTVEISTTIRSLLTNEETALVKRFLQVAPNMPGSRLRMLFEELGSIWCRNQWTERQHVLELLERLGSRDALSVKEFLERHSIFDHVLAMPASAGPGDRRLLRVLHAIAPGFPEWTWGCLIQLYAKSLPRAESRQLQVAILDTICARASTFSPSGIARRFEDAISGAANKPYTNDFDDLTRSAGRLWAIEWKESGIQIRSILEELAKMEDGLGLRARLNGLSYLLIESSEVEAKRAFDVFKGETDVFRLWLWSMVVFPNWLRGNRGDIGSAQTTDSVRFLRRKTRTVLTLIASEKETLLAPMRRALIEASLPPEILLEILSDVHQDEWLDPDRLAELLADAALANHPAASRALEQLISDPKMFSQSTASMVCSLLARRAQQNRRAVFKLIQLSVKIRDSVRLFRALAMLEGPVEPCILRYASQLDHFRQSLVDSTAGQSRRIGLIIWLHLLRLGLVPEPILSELQGRFQKESDLRARASIARLIAQASIGPGSTLKEIVDILGPMSLATDEDLRTQAFDALARAVAERSNDPDLYAKVLDIALTQPTNAGRLSMVGHLVTRLLPQTPTHALEMFERLLLSPQVAAMGAQAKRVLINRLRTPARHLVSSISSTDRLQLIGHVPGLDRFLGRLVIEAICHEAFDSVVPQLDALLQTKLDGDIKELIRRQKYQRERTLGGDQWPEVLQAVRNKSRL